MTETTKQKQAEQAELKPAQTAVVKTPGGNSLQLAVPEGTISALDDLARQGVLAGSVNSQFKRIFVTGAVMYNMSQILTPQVMQHIMWLQNSPIGFLTDRPNGYGVDEVRSAVIEAAIRGLDIVGNEFNILAGRFYVTKNGLKHMLRDIPGLLKNVTPGIPKMTGDKSATVSMHIDWTYKGKRSEKDIEFVIRVNSGMGADAIIGKATRKAYAWLYEEVTGNAADDGDVGDMVPISPDTARTSPLEAEPPREAKAIAQGELPM